jgi:hypothetical protein
MAEETKDENRTFYFACTCGHGIYRGGESKEDAVNKVIQFFDQTALDAHFDMFHKGEQKPTLAQTHEHLKNDVVTATEHLKITNPPVIAQA